MPWPSNLFLDLMFISELVNLWYSLIVSKIRSASDKGEILNSSLTVIEPFLGIM